MSNQKIAAIILAAGQSKRMGAPKLLLPWGDTTVLGQVVKICALAEGKTDLRADAKADQRITDMVIVTGGWRSEVEAEVVSLAEHYPVRVAFNADYERGEMLSSIQVGLRATNQPPPSPHDTFAEHTVSAPKYPYGHSSVGFEGGRVEAALIALGDQPQVRSRTVQEVLRAFEEAEDHISVPSYHLRRGHPILIPRIYWDEILHMQAPQTLRDFLNAHASDIVYVDADETVLQDLDTPEDYKRTRGA